jgi:hypothetical protein
MARRANGKMRRGGVGIEEVVVTFFAAPRAAGLRSVYAGQNRADSRKNGEGRPLTKVWYGSGAVADGK